MHPFAAALLGAREIGFTVFSISMSLIAVFIPILMMGGIVGRLFREFAITLSAAILVSMVISLTTTPMMCAHLLKMPRGTRSMASLYRIEREVLRRVAIGLSAFASLGARQSGADADRTCADDRPQCGGLLCEDSQGILSAAGHRRDRWRGAGPAGCLLPFHGLLASASW